VLYSCAIDPSGCQLIRRSLQSIGSLTQFPSTEIKLFSKALLARLIPPDAVKDDAAVLILIKDDEVNHLISTLASVQSYDVIPGISIVVDLCRSPHNMLALVSRDAVSTLTDVMDRLGEDDQSKAAQLIWRMMELNFESNADVSAIINNGTVEGIYVHV
jgi:hypothetical protein